MRLRLAFLLLTLIAAMALAGCGDDDSTSTPEAATAAGTKQAGDTSTTAPTGGATGSAPAPADPQLNEGLTEFTRGDLGEIDIPAGGVYYIDPKTLAAQDGDVPSCDNFQFSFSWQITDPYPPGGTALEWVLQRDTGNVSLSHDPAGEQSTGCNSLQAVNNGGGPIALAIKYAIGGIP